MDLFGNVADTSVRPAHAADASALGEAQVRSWRETFKEHLSATNFEQIQDQLDADAFAAAWREAITHPPSPAHRVMAALAGPAVVGFAASVPAHFTTEETEPHALEIVALIVDPTHQKAGHGSRLLASCVDLSADEKPRYITTWILAGEKPRERFFHEAGLRADGTYRKLTIGDEELTERRWSAKLDEGGDIAG